MSIPLNHEVYYNTGGGDAYIPYVMKMLEENHITCPFQFEFHIEISGDIIGIFDAIEEAVGSKIMKTIALKFHHILQFDDTVVVMSVEDFPFTDDVKIPKILITSTVNRVKEISTILIKEFPLSKTSSIHWYYYSDHKIQSTRLHLENKNEIKNEYVPWITPDIETFQKNFLASSANILLLIGIPGAGKTSFVRDFIIRNNLSAAVTYDEALMGKDAFFIEFINGLHDVLVIEDADIILKDRESGNTIMSKLLNASDGLIQTNKKIVFTANLTELDEVDQALLRPGRCFEALIFRELTFNETKRAALAAGLPEPEEAKTLSKLFSDGPSTQASSRMGFHLPK